MTSSTIDDNDAPSPGWDAISARLDQLYPGQGSKHFGTLISHMLGGPDPLDGISAWRRTDPMPHWHFVTYGFSELYAKESNDPEVSGYGFELTFRLAIAPNAAVDAEPPTWALNFLQNLARYVFQSGNVFNDGDWMTANGPIALGQATLICSMGFVTDPELAEPLATPNGSVAFLQVVGLTLDEERAAKQWHTRSLLDVLLPHMPLWVTDLDRASLLGDPTVKQQVDEGVRRDGSSSGYLFTDVLDLHQTKRLLRKPLTLVTLGARQVDELVALLPLRLPFGRTLRVAGHRWQLLLEPSGSQGSNAVEWQGEEESAAILRLTNATVQQFVQTLQPREGRYVLPLLPQVKWQIEKTTIQDSTGRVVDVVG
ncbi:MULTISPECIES: suppressor of fused domain protein [unclassified Acidovorax]|uniref:suppressor of fused domain protein n=1 Tax=unclassified Acidovorax TaxID=2684926 RepID=UPI001C470FE9|nr:MULTISPECIES: suppressor of fused domain protein [unclassified Acidovorax]MBV7429837.1 suppressor of fused domain protein [Acidovorax sp. sif0732]MBV7448915.1 suppressor of fused domain protein [Acidovorax sp. sif0715]